MAVIRNNTAKLIVFDFKVRLIPGENTVAQAILDGMRQHPIFVHRFSIGELSVVSEEKVVKAPPPPQQPKKEFMKKKRELAKSEKPEEAKKQEILNTIPMIGDVNLLRKMIKTEADEMIVRACEERLRAVLAEKEEEHRETIDGNK